MIEIIETKKEYLTRWKQGIPSGYTIVIKETGEIIVSSQGEVYYAKPSKKR